MPIFVLETALHHIDDAVLISEATDSSDPEGATIVFANAAFERMTGYASAELLGRTAEILRGPDTDREEVARLAASLAQWQPATAVLLNYRRDGSPFWVELSVTPVADEAGRHTHWVAVQREVSERVARQQALHGELAFNRAVLDSLSSSTCVLDHDGRIVMTNRRWDDFALDNGGTLGPCGAGVDYLQVTAADPDGGTEIVDGIRKVLDGTASHFELVYSCHAPEEQRWFQMQVVPLDADRGGAVVSHTDVTSRVLAERRTRVLMLEQAALRQVATAIAQGATPDAVAQLAVLEVREATGSDAAAVVEYLGTDEAVVRASVATGAGSMLPGTILPLTGGGELATLLETRSPVVVGDYGADSTSLANALGYDWSVTLPVHAAGRLWGAVSVAGTGPADVVEVQALLDPFAELLSAGMDRHEARMELERRAASDALTGLDNHRAAQERLGQELQRARRRGRALSVAVIDIDHFKTINDHLGHHLGDDVLRQVAQRLRGATRADDVLARIGGDEFALIMPETDRTAAYAVVERARRAVSDTPMAGNVAVSVSAGLCDLASAPVPEALMQYADGALYWSKTHGRNATWTYDPATVEQLSAQERADHMERSRALTGLRALARAIDAKDPTTREHSERVAALATALAVQLGWPAERTTLLAEASLVHDVGKIGVPDAVLLKPGRLDAQEYAIVREHAELGARIVDDVLSPEQVSWVRHHHERPDGGGYPAGLHADEIPEGAALIAVADCFDVMTVSRPYQPAKSPDEAVAECRALAGRQFAVPVVDALEALSRAGKLAVSVVGV